MADKLTLARRSWNMSRIRSRDTKPEIAVRKTLHKLGYRFRLHRRDLPGRPDIVIPKHRIAIFVHGCFWHQHNRCADCSRPQTNREYWQAKLAANLKRDKKNRQRLNRAGWKPVVIWECQTSKAETLKERLLEKLKT